MNLTPPHCDQRVLHAPGECEYCDDLPEWQQLRELWGINFTGQDNRKKTMCPSEVFRDTATINRWPGNVAAKKGSPGVW